MDVVTRLGGEEFVAILPGTTLEQTLISAEQVPRTNGPVLIRVTVSVGIAAAEKYDDEVQILKRADDAMYIAKRNGRYVKPAGEVTVNAREPFGVDCNHQPLGVLLVHR